MALSKYVSELGRLSSFVSYQGPNNVSQLARIGFYWSAQHLKLCCYNCDFSVNNGLSVDDIIHCHMQHSPDCDVANKHNKTDRPTSDSVSKLQITNTSKSNIRTQKDRRLPAAGNDATDCEENNNFSETCQRIHNRASHRKMLESRLPVNLMGDPDYDSLKNEQVRLRTFYNWPARANVAPTDLARSGFFYTGFSDEVRCVFCKGTLSKWEPGDVVADRHQQIFRQCEFAKGHSVSEEDVGAGELRETVLESSVATTDHWTRQDSATTSVAAVRSLELESMANIEITEAQRTPVVLPPAYRVKHPEFIEANDRMRTFLNARGNLPRGQNVDTLVAAGFYYVGPADNVRCFCCDIGLKNWQIDDNPWVEHARWQPRCSFLREMKDEQFIEEARADRARGIQQNANQYDGFFGMPSVNIDQYSLSAMENSLMATGHVSGASEQAAIGNNPLELPGAVLRDQQPMAAAGVVHEDNKETREGNDGASKYATDADEVDDQVVEIDREAQKLLDENRQLRDVRTCKVCVDKEVDIVFLPCGHLVCCQTCAALLKTCAVCRTLIRGTVKIKLAGN